MPSTQYIPDSEQVEAPKQVVQDRLGAAWKNSLLEIGGYDKNLTFKMGDNKLSLWVNHSYLPVSLHQLHLFIIPQRSLSFRIYFLT